LHGIEVARAIEDALAGYDVVLDLVTGREPLSQSWIRQLHERLLRSQTTFTVFTVLGPQTHPMPKGVYKTQPNNPTNAETGRLFHYAPPSDTPAEMSRLLGEIGTDDFAGASPAVQAAYVHHAFVRIHPFADGNGRVARALASIYLYREPGVPLVIFADQRGLYLDALGAADSGSSQRFVSFIAGRTIDTIEMVRSSLE